MAVMMSKDYQPRKELTGVLVGPGVRAIGAAFGLPQNITRGLIEAGYAPAFKVGSRWWARRPAD